MLLYVLIVTTFCIIREGISQSCTYDVSKQNQISCFNMTSDEEIQKGINDTTSPYGNITWLIEILEMRKCNMTNFTINTLSFLPNLQEINVANSHVRTLLSVKPGETRNNTDFPLSHSALEQNKMDPATSYGPNNLRKVNLGGNQITDMFISALPSSIEDLLLDDNKISSIAPKSFSRLDNLELINLARNKINRINRTIFTDSTVLVLDLRRNEIDTIEGKAFASLKLLKILDLRSNRLCRLVANSFSGSSMSLLDLSDNQIEMIENNTFFDLENPLVIKLRHNRVTKIYDYTFSGTKVSTLDFNFNGLEEIESRAFYNANYLESLDFAWNNLTTIYSNTFSISSLKLLFLYANHISVIEPEAFDGTNNLFRLDLQGNKLNSIQKHMFSGLSVKVLYLNNNKIATIEPDAFKDLNNLTRLRLQYNLITRVDKHTFRSSTIQQLLLTGNPITNIEQGFLEELKNLNATALSSGNLNMIPTFSESLRSLFLEDCAISDIEPTDLKNLQVLFSMRNQITKVDSNTFSGSALEELYFSYNKIETIGPHAFRNLSSLRKLGLGRNQLKRIERNSFTDSTVEELDLSGNKITYVEPGAFRGLYLRILNLNDNKLDIIYRDTFQNSTIEKLSLSDNRIIAIIDDAFAYVNGLREIVLDNNLLVLSILNRNTFRSPTLRFLRLGNVNLQLHANASKSLSHLISISLTVPDICQNKNWGYHLLAGCQILRAKFLWDTDILLQQQSDHLLLD